jgi:hypothetical protein
MGAIGTAHSSARDSQIDPALARIIDLWPELPEPIRRAVLALIEHLRGEAMKKAAAGLIRWPLVRNGDGTWLCPKNGVLGQVDPKPGRCARGFGSVRPLESKPPVFAFLPGSPKSARCASGRP